MIETAAFAPATDTPRGRPDALPARPRWREVALLVAIVALAALLRLPGLDQRGAWDADQGTDMLVLQGLVDRGEVPLLGPRTSIGTFHHGAVYYYLLAPAAYLSGADPVVVTGEIALFGIGAVVAVWWLARLVAGPVAGLAAGLLMAVSPAGIEASTFIWNPNLIPLASAVAFAAALHAIRSRHARWWLVSGLGAMVVMQCHVLGVVVLPPLIVAWLADVRARRRWDGRVGPVMGAGAGAIAIIAVGYLPLLAYELGHDFAETRAILAYVGGGGSGAASGVLGRIGIVGLRSVSWPIAGLLTDRLVLSLVAVAVACTLAAASVVVARGASRRAAVWLAGSVLWAIVALALFAPSLAVITPGLPNDHYHSFLDPLVLALVAAGLAHVAGRGVAGAASPLRPVGWRPARACLLVAVSVLAWPPAVSPDGGWRLADQAAARTIATLAGGSDPHPGPFALEGIPPFKNVNAMRFPLEHRGAIPIPSDHTAGDGTVVLVCDPLFDDVMGVACGGPAEGDWAASAAPGLAVIDSFEAGPRRVITIYRASP